MHSSRRRFARWAARRVRGAQERGRLFALWTPVLARRARRRVSRCSIALQLCASRGSVFGTGVRFVDASARRDSETMIYITCALATCRAAPATLELLGERGYGVPVARIEGARSRPHRNLNGGKSAYGQSTPQTPSYQLFGVRKGDAGAQCSDERAALSRRLRLLPRRETVNPSAGPSVGTYRTTSNGRSEQ